MLLFLKVWSVECCFKDEIKIHISAWQLCCPYACQLLKGLQNYIPITILRYVMRSGDKTCYVILKRPSDLHAVFLTAMQSTDADLLMKISILVIYPEDTLCCFLSHTHTHIYIYTSALTLRIRRKGDIMVSPKCDCWHMVFSVHISTPNSFIASFSYLEDLWIMTRILFCHLGNGNGHCYGVKWYVKLYRRFTPSISTRI